jgi:hypothetical protein
MWHVRWRRATNTGVLWGNLKNREYLQDLVIDGSIILKSIFKQWAGKTSKRLIWLRIKTHGGFLGIR